MNTFTNFIVKHNHIRVVLIMLYITVAMPILGQVKEVHNVPSPEVANLGTFGAIPIGHYTGTPNISIPLYSIKVGKLSIPIQAIYHPANVKPHIPPSCLGIGWALSAGGYIARSIKVNQDEKEIVNTKPGYYFNHEKIKELDNASEKGKTQKLKELTYLEGNEWFELGADAFYFTFNGYSGSFFMDKEGQWRVISDENIKVEFYEQSGFKTINELKKRFSLGYYNVGNNKRFFDKFTLITPDGTRYEFGGDNATEYSVPYYNQVYGDLVATCWRLSKITTVDRRVVKFLYKADSYMCDIHYAPQAMYYFENNRGVGMHLDNGRAGYSGFLTMPARLMEISADNETVSFSYERDAYYGSLFLKNSGCLYWSDREFAGPMRYGYGALSQEMSAHRFMLFMGVQPLSSERATRDAIAQKITHDYLSCISVQKQNSWVVDIITNFQKIRGRRLLSSLKFEVPKTWPSDERRNLSPGFVSTRRGSKAASIEDAKDEEDEGINTRIESDDENSGSRGSGLGSLTEYMYKFEYYLDSNQERLWPVRNPLTYTDSWGYYSRLSSNQSNSGEWRISAVYTNEDFRTRTPSLQSTKMFVLKSITYPTGGITELEYEQHDYSKEFDRQSFSVKDAMGTVGGLRVSAMANYDVSGRLLYTKDYIYKHSLNGQSSGISKGRPCYYDRIYLNDDRSDYIDMYSFDPIEPYPLNFNTPDVGYSTVFEDVKNANGKLLKRTKFQYTNYDADVYGEMHGDKPAVCGANVFGTYASASFTSMAFERGKLVSKEVMNGDGNVLEKIMYKYVRTSGVPYSTISQECHRTRSNELFGFSYLYNTFTNKYLMGVQKREEKMNNGSFVSEMRYKYTDYGMPKEKIMMSNDNEKLITKYTYSFDSPQYSWLLNKHILLPISVTESRGEATSETFQVYSQSSWGVPYVLRQETSWRVEGVGNVSHSRIDYTVERADQYGNPIVIDERGAKTIMIWCQRGEKLVATIQNASYEEVKASLGKAPDSYSESDFLSSTYDDVNKLRSKLPRALIYSYLYNDLLLLRSKMEPNGMEYSYDYDSQGRVIAVFRRKGKGKFERINAYKYHYQSTEQ